MKNYLTLIFLLFVLLSTHITKCDELTPKQVIEKYYKIMMGTCWGCWYGSLAFPENNPSLVKLITKNFHPVGGVETLSVALPPIIDNCKIKGNEASCGMTNYILGEQTPDYNTFCELHQVTKTIYKLKTISGTWKISSVKNSGGKEGLYDNSKLISVTTALKRIDEYIAIYRKTVRRKNAAQADINIAKVNIKMLEKDKKGIKEIESKALKYGLRENEVFVKDLVCN